MTGSDLARMYGLSFGALKRNLEDISHEETLINPQPAGNNMNWVLGHIVVARGTILALTGGVPVLTGEAAAHYNRGVDAADVSHIVDLATLRGMLEDSQQQLTPALSAMSDDQLAAPLPEKFRRPPLSGSVGDALVFLLYHEGYHNGQLGMLRRLAGKEGAIR
jgi:uncharacterized damage-inducible protein DinB